MDTLDIAAYTECVDLFRDLVRCAVKTADTSHLAFSYLRFSSPAQAEGDSVRRQTALRDAWLKRNPNVKLDTSLKLTDAGVSGFRGDHRKDKKHALGAFMDLVHRGRVPAGSFLIVENLDRLSREHPLEVIGVVGDLVRAGVRVVQLVPETVFTADMDEGTLCMLLLGSIRGHGESKRKSGLCGEAWGQKKEEARVDKKPHGVAVPAWIELAGGKYRVREDAGKAVRLIFQLSAEGLGTLAIAQRLRAEGVPAIARGNVWIRSYVSKILDNRAVLGEYQPMKGHRGRVPDGEVIAGYFPPVVSESDWHRAHAAKDARNKRSGRPGKKGAYTFPFSGMLRDARGGCAMHVITRKGKKYILSADAACGVRGTVWAPFPLDVFNGAVLSMLKELQAADLFADPDAGRLTELAGRLGDVEKRLAVALARFEADPESPTWANRVDQYDREKRGLVKELADARQKANHPASAAWTDAVELMAQEEPERLRAALLTTIESVTCLVVQRGRDRLLAAQVWFVGEGNAPQAHRDYLIFFRPVSGNQFGVSKPIWHAWSLSEIADADDLDLRREDDVKALETELLALDLDTLV